MISNVASTLEAMNPEQYVLAFVFLGSYAYALGEFIGTRGRLLSMAVALACAIGFAMLSDPWEHGVMAVTLALVGMGLFTCLAWTVWTLACWRAEHQVTVPPRQAEAAPPRRPARHWFARWRFGLR
ncbi:MAG TPA: hypothetical protein VGE16_11260 [Albitalea sp.]